MPCLTTDAAGAHLDIFKGGGRIQVDAHDCVAQGGRQDHVDKPFGPPNGGVECGQEGCLVGVQCIAAASTRAGQEGAQREKQRRSVEKEAEDSLCPVAGDGDGDVGEGDDCVPAAENPSDQPAAMVLGLCTEVWAAQGMPD